MQRQLTDEGARCARDRCICTDDRTVSDMNTGHDRHSLTDPYIVSDDGIAFLRQLTFLWCDRAAPSASHDVERISRYAIHPVICRTHHKFDAGGNVAELADD